MPGVLECAFVLCESLLWESLKLAQVTHRGELLIGGVKPLSPSLVALITQSTCLDQEGSLAAKAYFSFPRQTSRKLVK